MIIPVVVDNSGGPSIGPAIRISVMADAGGQPVTGKLMRVVQVTDADIAAGRIKVAGGRVLHVVLSSVGIDVVGGPTQQVYVAAGTLNVATLPANTVLPVISGTLTIGSLLSTTDGTWTGTAPITYTYQWKRGGVDIGGATTSTYTLAAADSGATITVTVTATNAAGAVSATSIGTTAPAYLLYDQFTGVNGSALAAHAMDIGAGWTANSGTWTLQSNRANGGTSAAQASALAGQSDVTVTMVVRPAGNGTLGALCRFTSTTAAWLAGVFNSGGKYAVAIFEINPGFTSRASLASAVNYATGVNIDLKVVLAGNTITVSIPSLGLSTSYALASFNATATRFGLRAADIGDQFDDFLVTQP